MCKILLNLGKLRFAFPSLPLHPCLWSRLLTVGNRVVDWKKGPELALTLYFETTSFFSVFFLFNIIINYIKNQKIKCSAVRRRKVLRKKGIALLHVIEVGYNTPHHCHAENTKRFELASLSRYSNLRIKL